MPAVMPSQGARYAPMVVQFNNPTLTTHLSMSSLGSTPRTGNQDAYASYNRQQIYKKINHWFTGWQPWQRRMLLCGLTNRCSTSQLESIATTLEPLFHRDFVTSLRKRYPSAPFKRVKNKHKGRKQIEEFARQLANEIIDNALTECIKLNPENENEDDVVGDETNEDGTVKNNETSIAVEGNLDNITVDTDELDNAQGITIPVPSLTGEEKDPVTLQEPASGEAEEGKNQAATTKPYSNPENRSGDEADTCPVTATEGHDGTVDERLENINEAEDEFEENVDQASELGFSKFMPMYDGPKMIHISRPFLSSFQYAPKLVPEEGTAVQSYKDNLGLLLTRQHTSLTNHQQTRHSFPSVTPPSSSIRGGVHRHRSGVRTADVRTTDFFDKGRINKLGPVQAQLRTGNVRRPNRVTDLSAPVQKMYKHVLFWDPKPKEGKTYIKPKKSHLQWHFKEQVNRIWEWMNEWEDFEKLNLLVEVVKQCDQELLDYLTQCLIERLRERVDISWLSDPLLLLIFSYLPEADIDSCSRVCRRWRYLSSCNELWMIKSHEFGLDQGIPNILDLVRGAGQQGHSVDWRLAYMEIQAITAQAKTSLPLPSRLAFQGATPVGMKRVGGKFIPASEPGSVRGHSRASGASASSVLTAAMRDAHASIRRHLILREPESIPQTPVLEAEEGETRNGLGSIHEQASSGQPPESSFPSRGVSRYQSEMSPVKSERLLASRDEPRASKISSRRGKRKERAPQASEPLTAQRSLRQHRGRRKGGDEEEDVALDVRPELVQAKDLLSKGATIPTKLWTAEDAKEARERLENYVSKAEPIRRVRKLQGHMDAVLSIEFDARRLVSGSMDRSIRIWDIRSGRSLHKLYGHKGGVTCLCFDNETLYSGSWDTAVMVWDLLTFERVEVLTGHKGSVCCLAMNDTYVFSGSHDYTVRVWRRTDLFCERVIEGHGSHVTCMALQGPHVITGSSDRSIRITDFLTGECTRIIRTTYPINTLWLTGSLVLTGNQSGELHVINKQTGEAEVAIRAHDTSISSVTFHSNHIFTASADSTIKEWDMMTMACVRSLQGHKGAVKDFKISSRCMVSAGADGHVRVWDKILPMFTQGDDDDQMRMEVIDHNH